MRLRKDLEIRQVGEDFVIIEPDQGMMDFSKVYTLNETAAWLWQSLYNMDFTVEDVIALLKEEYDLSECDQQTIEADAHQLLTTFKKNNLLAED